jgi:hypothetical protein
MTLLLGVDPGLSGGIALLRPNGSLLAAEAMPVLRNAVPTVDVRQLGHLLKAAEGAEVFAYVERAQAYPRQGVSSAFNYGLLFGSILTAIADLGIGYELVQATKWKRDLGLHSDKRESVDRVKQLYPTFSLRKTEDGIAEAILIARWALTRQQVAA